MNTSTHTTDLIADRAQPARATGRNDLNSALRFITCGSVDDGKSTLIGRLLVDSKAVLQDHLAGVQRGGATDLALLTDGLSAEREQGITIDVAYRYFNTENRKFIIGDAPGHEQYTRNMVTAASSADAAVVLVDATKLDWKNSAMELLQQTRRHSLLVNLLRVPSIVFAVNKLDAVDDSTLAFKNISAALTTFARAAKIPVKAIVPISALIGHNVVDARPGWCAYEGPSLLELLEHLPATAAESTEAFAFPVQWVEKPAPTLGTDVSSLPPEGAVSPRGGPSEKPAPTLVASRTSLPPEGAVSPGGGPSETCMAPTLVASRTSLPPEGAVSPRGGPSEKPAPTLVASRTSLPPEGAVSPRGGPSEKPFLSSSDTSQGRRVFWGRVATGGVQPGQTVTILSSGQSAVVAQVLDHTRQPKAILAGHSAGIVLDREVDVSRGDWLLQTPTLAASRAALPPEGALAPRGGPSALDGDAFNISLEISVTIAWMDDEPLVAGRVYWALHGHRWVKAKVKRIVHKLDVNTLAAEDAGELPPNAIGHIELSLQEPLATLPYARSRVLGSLVLVDTASNKTSGAALIL